MISDDLRKMLPTSILFSFIISVGAEILSTKQGVLNGTYMVARNGKTFNTYYGIPFAQPPVGPLRFKAPIPANGWEGVRDATVSPFPCVQKNKTTDEVLGSEDCLYLNVHTPLNTKKGDNVSVIVYLFGGVFKYSSNIVNGPNYFLGNNVIMVMPNFREGVLGFLSTGDSVIPGNFGLKDQNMALKWVQKNIYDFGGDPSKVTLHGHSSGAVCVHLHTLSPMSKGLFQKVIIQSGTGFCSLSYFGPDVSKAIAKELTARAGCQGHTSEDILSCVMSMDAYKLPLIQNEMYVWENDPDATFRPTVESADVEDAFLTDFPENLKYHSPDLPWIIGLTSGEGSFEAARNNSQLARLVDQDYELIFPISLQYLWNTKAYSLDYVSQTLRTHYFQNKSISFETSTPLTNLYTHGLFGICTIDAVYSYPGPKYIYLYDYRSNYSSQAVIPNYTQFIGVAHADEIHLFFYKTASAEVFTPQDIIFSDELIKRWLNFVDTGNPNGPQKINETLMSHWEPMCTDNIEYLFINLNGTMRTNLYKGTYQFWKSLPIKNKYHLHPYLKEWYM